MTIGSGGSIGTTPPGSETQRSSSTVVGQCLMDHLCLKSVGICGKTPQNRCGSRFRPRGGRRRLRYGGRLPNLERSSPPLLTVLLLLTGEHQEEGEWVEKTRVQTSGSGRHPEVFFWSPRPSACAGVFSPAPMDPSSSQCSDLP